VRVAPALLALLLLALGCVTPPRSGSGPRTLAEAADEALLPERRASIRLVEQASDALRSGDVAGAQILAERALRVDGRNPYAHLVLGEAAAEDRDVEGGLRHLERAEALFRTEAPGSRLFRARGLYAQADLLEDAGRAAEAQARRREADALLQGPAW